MLPLPLQTYLVILVGLVTRDQEEVIAYLQAENKVLREQLDAALDGKRMRFTERQRNGADSPSSAEGWAGAGWRCRAGVRCGQQRDTNIRSQLRMNRASPEISVAGSRSVI